MKKKLQPFVLFLLLSFNVFAQNWSFYKEFPVNVTPFDVVSSNNGNLYLLSSDKRIFFKTVTGDWTFMEDPSGFGPFNSQSMTINKNTNTLIVAEQLGGGIKTTSNMGATWQSSWSYTDPNTGFHESVYELSNVSSNGTFYSQIVLGDIVLRIGRHTNNGQNVQFIIYDPIYNPDKEVAELLLASNNTLLIGTWNHGIIISTDNGQTFQDANLNQHQIYKFTEDFSGRVFALGYNMAQDENFLVYSSDYINWTPMSLPNNTERYTSLFYDISSNYLWLGSETNMYRFELNTAPIGPWSNATFNNSNQHNVEIISDNQGYTYNFSYENNAQKLNGTDDGWINYNNGFTGNSNYIGFGSNNKLFSATYSNNNISSLTDENSNWSTQYLGGTNTGVSILFTKPNGNVYANTLLSLKKSNDNGLTYSDITPNNLNNFINKFYVGENNTLFVVKNNEPNNLYLSSDDGNTWNLAQTFPDPIGYIAQDSNGVSYVKLDNLDISSGFFKIYYSTNNGVTWDNNIINVPNGSFFDIPIFSKNQFLYVTLDGLIQKYDYITNSLSPLTPPNNAPTFEGTFAIDNNNNYYMFGENLYKSTNGSASWYSLSRPNEMVAPYYAEFIVFDSNNNPYILTKSTANVNQHGIYKVIDVLSTDNPSLDNPFVLFPNPVDEVIYLNSSDNIKNITIYDALGKQINSISNVSNEIEVANYAQGMYLVKISTNDGSSYTMKFIKK